MTEPESTIGSAADPDDASAVPLPPAPPVRASAAAAVALTEPPAPPAAALQPAGRYVIYPYCISVLIMSFKRRSGIVFVPEGKSAVTAGLRYLVISLLFGWWGLPWGIIWTIECVGKCVGGGIDVTDAVTAYQAAAMPPSRRSGG